MRILLIFLLLAIPISSKAEEPLDAIIQKLDAESFDEREETTSKLAKYDVGYISAFLALAQVWHDTPEIAWRLRSAAKQIFDKNQLKEDERYRLLYGSTGLSWEVEWNGWHGRYQGHNPDDVQQPEVDVDYVTITGVLGDSPASTVLQQDDKILEINGKGMHGLVNSSLFQYGLFEPDTDYTVKIKRVICNRDVNGNIVGYEEKELEVKFKSEKKQDYEVDSSVIDEIEKGMWTTYLNNFNATHK